MFNGLLGMFYSIANNEPWNWFSVPDGYHCLANSHILGNYPLFKSWMKPLQGIA